MGVVFKIFVRGGIAVERITKEQCAIDDLAEKAGGYFALPTEDDIAYTDLLFDLCRQFKIHYYSTTPKKRAFVEEVTRITWRGKRKSGLVCGWMFVRRFPLDLHGKMCGKEQRAPGRKQ